MVAKALSILFFLYKTIYSIRGKRPKILVYTDSRGYDVSKKYGRAPFFSYMKWLVRGYCTEFFICPEKFTTIYDFILFVETVDLSKYDAVILHCGIVDFSPRPLSNIRKVRDSKIGKEGFNIFFIQNEVHYKHPSHVLYYGEPTVTLYSVDFLQRQIAPKLEKIKKLVWIDSNKFVKGWEGNFVKGRPVNIQETVNEYEMVIEKYINHRVSLKDWSEEDVKTYTIDNIHFTPRGFKEIFLRVDKVLKDVV